jgi:hypothetical protein
MFIGRSGKEIQCVVRATHKVFRQTKQRFLVIFFALLGSLVISATARPDANSDLYNNVCLDVERLILDWRFYQTYTVAVKGAVHCTDEDYCAFDAVPGFRQIVWIDVYLLPVEDKRYLLSNCREASCIMIVTGAVMDNNLAAQQISTYPTNRVNR